MPGGESPRGLLITISATTVMIQATATLEYSPSTRPITCSRSSSISISAISVLNTTQTTRPGWLWVRREKKLDHASEPA